MAQYGLPTADVSRGTGTFTETGDGDGQHWDELDEGFGAGRGSGSGPDDATTRWYVAAVDEASTFLEVTLNNVTDPATGSGHIIRGRYVKADGSGVPSAFGQQVDGYVALKEGTTVRASANSANLLDTYVTTAYTLTSTEADTISSYSGLRMRIWGQVVGGGATRRISMTAVELEVPDAAGGAPTLTATQAITIAEAASLGIAVLLAAAQALTVAEMPTLGITLRFVGADQLTVAETATVVNPLLPVLTSQDITAVEAANVALTDIGVVSLAADQAVTLAEAASLAVAIPGLVLSQDVIVAETPAAAIAVDLTTTQAITVAETTAASILIELRATQAVTVAEAAVVEIAVTPQFARPVADVTRINWEEDDGVTTDIWDQIDEVSVDDADYIRTALLPTNAVYVTKLTSLLEPTVNTGHILRYRLRKDSASGAPIDLTVQLRQGYASESDLGILIEQWLETDIDGSGWITRERTINPSNVDNITDYPDLYVRVIANAA